MTGGMMKSETIDNQDERYRLFQREYLQSRQVIFTFLFILVGHRADAEDLFQEACVVMWKKFDSFTPGTSFVAWAKQICRHLVMDVRKKRRRRKVVSLDDKTVDLLATRYERIQNQVGDRIEVLKQCVEKLSFRDHELIEMAYQKGQAVKQIATECRVSVQRIYKRLGDVHKSLLFCLRQTLAQRGITL